MKLDEILNPPSGNLSKLYLDLHDGDATAANTAMQNDIKNKTPLASLVNLKPKKPLDKNNLKATVQNAQQELQKAGLQPQAAQNLQKLKMQHGV